MGYLIGWCEESRPKVRVTSWRCFEYRSDAEPYQIARTPFDIPICDTILAAITRHARQPVTFARHRRVLNLNKKIAAISVLAVGDVLVVIARMVARPALPAF